MDILYGDGFYGHYIFYRLLPIDLLLSLYGLKCTFAFYDFLPCAVAWSVLFVWPHCFMYWVLYMLCQKWRNKDVQSI